MLTWNFFLHIGSSRVFLLEFLRGFAAWILKPTARYFVSDVTAAGRDISGGFDVPLPPMINGALYDIGEDRENSLLKRHSRQEKRPSRSGTAGLRCHEILALAAAMTEDPMVESYRSSPGSRLDLLHIIPLL